MDIASDIVRLDIASDIVRLLILSGWTMLPITVTRNIFNSCIVGAPL